MKLLKQHLGDEFNSFSYVMMCLIMAIYNKMEGNYDQATVYIEEGLSLCELKNIHLFSVLFMSILVKACSHLGNTGQTADVVHRLHSLLEDKNVGKKSFSSVFKHWN